MVIILYANLQQRKKNSLKINLKYKDSNEINGYRGLNYIFIYIDGMVIIYAINNYQMECEKNFLKYRMFFYGFFFNMHITIR